MLVCLLGFSSNLLAWGATGHRLICDIAWRHFTPDVKTQVMMAVKRKKAKTFADACTWPDRIRSVARYDHWKPLHYINQPRSQVRIETAQACSAGCVVTAIEDLTAQVTADWRQAGPLSQTQAERVLFLAHFIGDVHQPLHVSYSDDRGGNNQTVTFFEAGQKNLHWVWDTGLLAKAGQQSWRQWGRQLSDGVPATQRQAWLQAKTALDWANESFAVTRDIYATPVTVIDDAYFKRFYPVIEQRLQMAGVRLAQRFNEMMAE